ncbi:helix-turn-helix transcriptional regulator [Actinomadura rupiterrae]|uniref:helix-turn-helix transcriptional regulator n=1 Tax=Actinomadura rupiterrae TaxID=559627 RepID=UPI0020A2D4D5|nr:helix-turn-helix domain-containing protein [Actinomadura rupiterrae]MCP2337199.1 DNA-binding transcriptional MerR regulator [Actinomadura rupiterrae]
MNKSELLALVELPHDRTWTPQEVSRFLGVPVATLHQWRYLGTGPKAAKVGRHLRYLPADVLTWFRAQQEAA